MEKGVLDLETIYKGLIERKSILMRTHGPQLIRESRGAIDVTSLGFLKCCILSIRRYYHLVNYRFYSHSNSRMGVNTDDAGGVESRDDGVGDGWGGGELLELKRDFGCLAWGGCAQQATWNEIIICKALVCETDVSLRA